MKNIRPTIFRKFALIIFCLITVMGILFMIITYLATSFYHEASTELLNKDVAGHIAKFTSPFTKSGLSRQKADSVFQNAMVLSPASEVYFLDTTGKVLYFHASEKEIREWNINLSDVTRYINANGEKYIKGVDPKDPSNKKIFSAAVVQDSSKKLGFIYVILDSKRSENIMELLFGSHVLRLAIQAFVIIILLSLIFSLVYLKRISRNFQSMIKVLERFEAGDYSARFDTGRQDELQPVTHAFNKMANLLSSAIDKVTRSEKERKDFIAAISHDLRTPLSIARGYVETLLLKNDNIQNPAEQQQQFQLIYTQVLKIENMVSQLFELSKMDAVEFRPAKEPFVLAEIVLESVETFQMRARDKNIDLQCKQCTEHVWINADIAMIERVIQNLVDNALKNTNEGGKINIEISVENTQVLLTLENTGEMVPDAIMRWVNDFTVIGSYIGERPRKAGLGLLIVQKILQLHNTALSVINTRGKNIFTVAFPLYQIKD